MSQVLLCGHHWPSFTSPGPWLLRVRLGPCLAFSWRSLGLACWAGQSPRSPGSEGGNPSCCKHPLSHILGPFLSSGGSEELLPSHLLLRRPACHCHQHREKQYTGPSALLSPKLRNPWEGDTSWLGHRQGAWDLAGSGRRWTESQAGPDPQLYGRGFRPGSKPHAWGSTEHMKAGRWERSPGFMKTRSRTCAGT